MVIHLVLASVGLLMLFNGFAAVEASIRLLLENPTASVLGRRAGYVLMIAGSALTSGMLTHAFMKTHRKVTLHG